MRSILRLEQRHVPRSAESRARRPGLRTWLAVGMSLLILATSAPTSVAASRWKLFKPTSSPGRECIRVGGKDRRYYKLDEETPVTCTLHGPNRLRIYTRHIPAPGDTRRKSYVLRVFRDGKEVLTKTISARTNKTAHLCGEVGTTIGLSRNSYITVPKGKHEFKILVADAEARVAVRLYQQAKKKAKITLVSYSPEEYARICTLVTSTGREYPHYHFNHTQPLRFTIIGPTNLEVWTRADFDKTMMASTAFGIEVLRNGESHRTFHFDDVRKLSTVAYKEEECREIVPSERKKLTLSVPKGQWTYELRPAEHGHHALASRILIPKKDIANSSQR